MTGRIIWQELTPARKRARDQRIAAVELIERCFDHVVDGKKLEPQFFNPIVYIKVADVARAMIRQLRREVRKK